MASGRLSACAPCPSVRSRNSSPSPHAARSLRIRRPGPRGSRPGRRSRGRTLASKSPRHEGRPGPPKETAGHPCLSDGHVLRQRPAEGVAGEGNLSPVCLVFRMYSSISFIQCNTHSRTAAAGDPKDSQHAFQIAPVRAGVSRQRQSPFPSLPRCGRRAPGIPSTGYPASGIDWQLHPPPGIPEIVRKSARWLFIGYCR